MAKAAVAWASRHPVSGCSAAWAEPVGTYSVGRAGARAVAASSAFRFLCLRAPRRGATSPCILSLVPGPLCSALMAFVGGAGPFLSTRDTEGAGPLGALRSAFPVLTSSLWALPGVTFPFCWVTLGCFLESI